MVVDDRGWRNHGADLLPDVSLGVRALEQSCIIDRDSIFPIEVIGNYRMQSVIFF
jgi:hypothetical protein